MTDRAHNMERGRLEASSGTMHSAQGWRLIGSGGMQLEHRETFARNFQSSFRAMWLIAIGIVSDAAIAEDVVQEAAITALSKLDQFKPGTNFNGWMGKIVRYVALNHARKEQKRRAAGGDGPTVEAPGAGPSERFETDGRPDQGGWFHSRVWEALADVSDVARTCLLLRVVDGMTYADIADLLDIPQGTAMSHVHRTRQLLRGRLSNVAAEGPDEGEAAGRP